MGKRIAIVGGGNAGAELAKKMQDVAEVTLVEPRSHFVHAPATIRAVVEPSILDDALLSYGNLLKNGRIVQAKATAVDASGVTLEDGARVEADYVVVTTGSNYAAPFKPVGADLDGMRAASTETHAMLKAAEKVVIVGGGAVGVELAGEIAHAMPGKAITLVASGETLFADKGPKLGASLLRKLSDLGVRVIFGQRAEGLARTDAPFAGPVTLSNGETLEADIVFPVIGVRPVTPLLDSLPDISLAADGRVKVDSWMRPSSLPNVFAAGDAVDVGDAMTIVASTRQVPWLAKTLTAAINGKTIDSQKAYVPWGKAPILLPLGPRKGSSFLIIATVGDFLTSLIKGKDLFRSKYRKLLGIAN